MNANVSRLRRATRLPRKCWQSLACAVGVPFNGGPARSSSSLSQTSSVSVKIGDSSMTFSSGKFANLADGSALVQSGSTCVMVTAVSEKTPKKFGGGGVPLQVDYRERAAAAGRIPQNFLKRELRPGDNETLVSRFIDRSIRPFFPVGYSYDTQVICNMLAVDGKHDPEVLSLNGAAAALALSDIPWNGPVGAVRVALIDGEICINPTLKELDSSRLSLVVACTENNIVMVEGSACEVEEDIFLEAVWTAFKEVQPVVSCLAELRQWQKKPTRTVDLALPPAEVAEEAKRLCRDQINSILTDTNHMKMSRDEALFAVRDSIKLELKEKYPDVESSLTELAFWSTCQEVLQENVLEHQIRCDGRDMRELRPIHCEVDLLDHLHGSSVFKRGETQVISTVTFDSPMSAYRADLVSMILGAQKSKRFIVHYEFPPFSTNTTGRFLMPGRREIGHGSLIEKGILPVLPGRDFPFTIRLVSQVLDSNGSSSMASVCSGSLALFDAGVPLVRPAAGLACGLAVKINPDTREIEKYQILTDILGIEDAAGAMDFKLAGTRQGITSIQLDVKGISGIPFHIFEEAIMQSRDARYEVLDIMEQCQPAARPELKKDGPSYVTIEVPHEKRRKLIGAGGHRIRAIVAETGAEVQTISDDHMSIFAPTREAMDDVMERVEATLNEPEPDEPEFEFGAMYMATVKEIREYGFVLELADGATALLHKSQMSFKPITHPKELGLEVGQKISVKYLGRDPITGRHKISRKALLVVNPTSNGSNVTSTDSSR